MEHLTHTQIWIGDTLKLARQSRRPLSVICKEAGVSRRWLYMVEQGQIREPSIVKLLRVRQAAENAHAA